ncbi:methyl-accepting chemotaxis protein [Burkholderia sp. LMU1-1-1.1]|jgi:methyl-accepting chemotaxis protein|uniref:methyl-accepting chemotaxis protein n=1 Tax=Burkholderia sp. LMU1-1-1.1 TaxID=3135266 RepID=UPI0034147BD6
MKIQHLNIGPRLIAAFGVILAMLIVIAVLGISRLAAIEESMEEITLGNNVEANMASSMRLSMDDRMIALRNIVLLDSPAQSQTEVDRIAKQAELYAAAEKHLNETFALYGIEADERAILADIKTQETAALPLIAQVQRLGQANQNAEATKILIGDLRAVQRRWQAALAALEDSEKKQNEVATAAASSSYLLARNLMIGIGALAVLAGIVIALLITRSITVPVNRAVTIARTVAAGDLTSEIVVTGKDETALLLGALKDMNESLQHIVGQVRTRTESMTSMSQEIAAGNMDLSSRTEEQASSLEETASSMEELTSTVKQNADNARQADSLSHAASVVAGKGGAVIADVVQTMSAINASSKKIVEIINVIDGIAFQTNILALNAAVEAARAGEQGRGFAVVATEVRNLAQRSAAAAKDIKILIGDSVSKVESGSQLVEQAGATMIEVVDSVRRVSDIITEISAASREQSLGIEQINQAIMQMDGVTQQNAALVEQSAAAAASMESQAGELVEVVGKFVLRQDATVRSVPKPPHRHRPARSRDLVAVNS